MQLSQLELCAEKILSSKKKAIIAGALGVMFIASSVLAIGVIRKPDTAINDVSLVAQESSIEITTIGESGEEVAMSGENSWPGEVVSLDNLQVQPGREGTIAEWYARIGERVSQGQVMGTLSRPSQTPEIVSMLAEQSEDLAKMRTMLSAQHAYTETRIEQLKQLRLDIERTTEQKRALLGSSESSNTASSLTDTKKIQARTLLRGSVAKTYGIMSGGSGLPTTYSAFQLKSGIGAQDSRLRDNFTPVFFALVSDLDDANTLPEQSGLAYFEAASKLANASLPSDSSLTQADLSALKDTLTTNQGAFATLLGEIKSAELESVNTQKDSIDKLAEIDATIADLKKTLAVHEGDVVAKEAAYTTVKSSVSNGYSIVAPKSGVVSTILKKPGEFVSPGMPVATVTGSTKSERLVRFRIPNNVRQPTIGDMLSVTRPGFPSEVKSVKLFGIGGALDETGSYMADALFVESTGWPVGASIRVTDLGGRAEVTLKLSSILWNTRGEPYVWAVSEAGRVYAKKLTLGRTLGATIEVYEGLQNGDRYIVNPPPEIREDMLIDDITELKTEQKGAQTYEEMMRAMGM